MRQTLHAIEWPALLAEGQPEAVLICAGARTYLLHPTRDEAAWAILDFGMTISAKIGSPNDEVWESSWLFALGAELGRAYHVEGSAWREESRVLNSSHSAFDSGYWDRLRHYVFVFRERVFECLSPGFNISFSNQPLAGVIGDLADKIPTTREIDRAL